MRRDKLFGNMFMRLAACALMVFACAGEVWGIGNTISKPRLNPAFVKWQHEQKNQKPQANKASVTNVRKRTTRLLASTPEADADLLPLPEGLVPTMVDFSYLNSLNNMDVRSVSGALQASYDPRDKGLTPVRHQDPQGTGIGTCWAQASIGSMETWLKVKGYGLNQFSVKNMVNREGWDSNSWYGGNFIRSSAYLLRWDGPVWESDDPYTNKSGIVNYSLSSPMLSPVYHVQQTRLVPARTGALDNEALKKAIMEFGGLYATMKLYSPYYSGTSTLVDYWSDKGGYCCTDKGAGHAVTLVGWDDTYSKTNFNSKCRPVGNGAWIVKDSYGVDLPRDNGYIYVSYYDTTFAYTTSCAFPLIEGNDNYGNVYQYDEFGQVRTWGIPANPTQVYTSGYGANMFAASQAEELAAVGFYATIPNAAYKIRIYTGCDDASNPSSGTFALEQSGTVDDYAGFYTVPLKNTVAVEKGSRFAVVLMLSTPGAPPFSLEIAADGLTSNAIANAGESFFSLDGSNWYDFNKNANLTYGIPANFCLKAYTKSATASKPTLSSIAISGASSLISGETATFKCEATYSDGSKKTITPTWSITEGRNYATVSPAGLVTAKSVTAQQRVTVKASYTEDGVTTDATWGFYVTIAAPSVPIDVTATQGTETSCVRVNWTAPGGATEYAVYRATVNNSKNSRYLENVTVAKYNDTGSVKPIVPGVDYWYFIKAKNSSGTSGFSEGAMGWRKLSPPEVTASDTLLDKVTLEWGEVEGATHYRVYRALDVDVDPESISGWQTARTFDDVPPEKDIPYCYYVVAAVDASGNRPSDYSIVEDGMMVSPVTVDCLEIKGDASIASGGYADYTADAIYTDRHRVENVSPVMWAVSGDGATVSGNRVTAATVTENKKVVLSASCTENGKIARGEKQVTITAVKPNTPTGVTADSTSQGVTITWNAVAGAASYIVYRDGSMVGRVIPNAPNGAPETTYPDNTATPGVAYTYSVSAVNGAGESARSAGVAATVPLATPTGVTATSDRVDGVLISWRGVNGATYYRVSRATSGNGAKTELGTWTADASFLDTSAEAGTTYYYFVRAATSSDGANASEYSSPAVRGRVISPRILLSVAISGAGKVSASAAATYTCVVTYSDETTEIVTPTWSASPTSAATIDENGLLTAKAVVSDMKVMVAASYGGKTDTMEVTIVAPASASASVSNVRVKPRWPFSPLVDIDYTLTTSPEGTFALVSLSGQDNDHNLPLAARTLMGDGASGVVAAGERRITWDIGTDYPNLHVKSLDVVLDAMPCVISAPANLTASAGTSSYAVELTWDAVSDATGYEIWRSVSPSTANASNIVTVAEGTTYSDTDANVMQPYFYWVKTVTEYGTSDFGDYVYGYRLPPASGTVTLDPNGGTVSETSLPYTVGAAYGTLPRAIRSGYDFVGWFTAKDGGTEVTAYMIATDSIPTLYAHWSPCEYFVRFNANGGTGTMADMRVYHGIATNLSANAYSRNGCLFSGWATNENGAVVYGDRASITPSTNMTLYASWTIPLQYALDNDGLLFTTGGNAEWTGVFDDSAANGSAAKSGKITHSQSTWLRTTVNGKGTLSYQCKTSCESSFDKLTLTIDGRQYGTASGNGSGFNTLVYSVTNAGTHTVTWTYSKDSSVSQGDDCVWIDNVVWTPILFSASSGTSTDGIELEWEPAANVSSYIIWRSDTTNRTDAVAVNMAGASATRYVDTSAMPGVQYHYWLQVFTTGGSLVDVGSVVVGWRNFTAPTNFTVTEGVYTNRVVMSFDAVEGAMFYEFYMSQTNDLSTAQYIGYMYSTNSHVTASYSAIDAGVRYYFWVRVLAVTPNGENYARLGDGMMSGSAIGYIKKYYEVSFNANGGEGDMPQQDVLIGTSTNLAANVFTRAGYLFSGWATNSDDVVVYADGASITPMSDMALYAVWASAAPAWVSATDGTSSNEVAVTWASVACATSYEVWRGTTTDSSAAVRMVTLSGTSYSDSSALGGTRYYYWIKTICNGDKSDLSTAYDDGWRKMYTPSPTFKGNYGSVTNIVISWTSISGATKYRIYRSASGSSLGSLIAEPTTTTYTDTTISANRYYYYSVRAVGSMSSTAASSEFGKIQAYAGTYPHHSSVNISSLRSVLTRMGHITQTTVIGSVTMPFYGITDDEIGQAMTKPSEVDLDGNTASISDKEQLVFGCIYDCWQKGCISGGLDWSVGSSDESQYKCEKINNFIVGLSDGTATYRTMEVSTNLVISSTNTGVRVVYNRNRATAQPVSEFVLVYRTDVAYPIGIMDYQKITSKLQDLLANLSGGNSGSSGKYGYVFTDTTAVSGKTYTYYVRVYSYEYGISPKSKKVTGKR